MSKDLKAITMPKWGLSMKEGSILKWIKSNGENIKKGEMLLEIETEKVVNEMESPEDSKILKICASEGDTVPVGSLIAVCGEVDTSEKIIDEFIDKFNSNFQLEILEEKNNETNNEKIKILDIEINFIKNTNSKDENVLFIHGFGGDLNNWMFNQDDLANNFNTFAIDLPGHGMSTKKIVDSSLDGFANLISSFCEKNNLDKVNLVGHSLGGGISIKTAFKKKELIKSLTLISPIGLGDEIDSDYIDNFISSETRKEIKKEIEKLYFNSEIITRDMLNEILKFLRIDNVKDTLKIIKNEIIENNCQKNNLIEEINSLNIPVSVIWGEDDQIIPSKQSDVLSDKINLIKQKNCGHMAHIEKAKFVNEVISKTILK